MNEVIWLGILEKNITRTPKANEAPYLLEAEEAVVWDDLPLVLLLVLLDVMMFLDALLLRCGVGISVKEFANGMFENRISPISLMKSQDWLP